jgi:hypothetical protein
MLCNLCIYLYVRIEMGVVVSKIKRRVRGGFLSFLYYRRYLVSILLMIRNDG